MSTFLGCIVVLSYVRDVEVNVRKLTGGEFIDHMKSLLGLPAWEPRLLRSLIL